MSMYGPHMSPRRRSEPNPFLPQPLACASSHRGPGSHPEPSHVLSRVMSPNEGVTELATIQRTRQLSPMQICDGCHTHCENPVLCNQCMCVGHDSCLGMERIEGVPHCGLCIASARARFAAFRTAAHRERWLQIAQQQHAFADSLVVNAAGAMTAIGTAATGVGAAVVAGSVALASSVVETAASSAATAAQSIRRRPAPKALAVNASLPPSVESESFEDALGDIMSEDARAASTASVPATSVEQVSVGLPPVPPSDAPTRPRRPGTTGMLGIRSYRAHAAEGVCLVCVSNGRSHRAHTYAGNCRLAPVDERVPPQPSVNEVSGEEESGGAEVPTPDLPPENGEQHTTSSQGTTIPPSEVPTGVMLTQILQSVKNLEITARQHYDRLEAMDERLYAVETQHTRGESRNKA